MRRRNIIGGTIAVIGFIATMTETGLSIYARTSPNLVIVGIGVLAVFVGGYIMYPKLTEEIADSAVEHFTPFNNLARIGRRKTDPVIAITPEIEVPERPILTDHDEGII